MADGMNHLKESLKQSRTLIERSRALVLIPNAVSLDAKVSVRGKIRAKKFRHEELMLKNPLNNDVEGISTDHTDRLARTDALLLSLKRLRQQKAKYRQLEPLVLGNSAAALQSPAGHREMKQQQAKKRRERVLSLNVQNQTIRRQNILAKISQRESRHSEKRRLRIQRETGQRWITLLLTSNAVSHWSTQLLKVRKQQKIHCLLQTSAKVIQRWFRDSNARVNGARRLRLWIVLRTLIWRCRMKRNCVKRRKHAEMVRSFFKDYEVQTKFQNVIQRFRLRVIRCQRYVKSYLLIQQHRRQLLSLLWDSVEQSYRKRVQKNRSVMSGRKRPESSTSLQLPKAPDDKARTSCRQRSLAYGNAAQQSTHLEIQVNALIRTIVWKLQNQVEATSCVIYVRDVDTGELYFRVTEHSTQQRVSEEKGIAGYVAKAGIPINLKKCKL